MRTIITLVIGIIWSQASFAQSCPNFVFFCDNPNRCDGSVDLTIAACPDFATPYTIDYVVWDMGGGITETTTSLEHTYTYTSTGIKIISATVFCTVAGTPCSTRAYVTTHANPTVSNLCGTITGSTSTTFNVQVTVFDFSLYVSAPTPQPQTMYSNTPVSVMAATTGSMSSAIGSYQLWVDGNTVAGAVFPNILTNYVFSTGQHLIEVELEDKGMGCKFRENLLIEIIDSLEITTCPTCFTFRPLPGERYWVSAWVKAEVTSPVKTYENVGPYVEISYTGGNATVVQLKPTGEIIDGWQRIAGEFTVPATQVTNIQVDLVNGGTVAAYFDDIRIHPFNASMKSYVNDPSTFWLLAELDDNNYATFYEYDKEGKLIRIKKETERGIMTIQESRMSNPKTN